MLTSSVGCSGIGFRTFLSFFNFSLTCLRICERGKLLRLLLDEQFEKSSYAYYILDYAHPNGSAFSNYLAFNTSSPATLLYSTGFRCLAPFFFLNASWSDSCFLSTFLTSAFFESTFQKLEPDSYPMRSLMSLSSSLSICYSTKTNESFMFLNSF